MSNSTVVREFFQAFYTADDAALDRLTDPAFAAHVPGGRTIGAAEWRSTARMILDAVPDIRTQIEAVVAEGDLVCVRYTSSGTHKGVLFGAAPTDREVSMPGIEIYRVAGGRVAECWGQYDMTAVPGAVC